LASIRRKPSGRWEARYRDAQGAMHAQTFPTKTAAVQWSRETETDVRRGDWIDPRLGRRTFRDWSDEYLSTIVHLRTVTRRDYERQLRVHIVPVFGDRPIDQIDIRRFMSDLRATGMAPKTLQKVRLVLRPVLETARGSGRSRPTHARGSAAREPRPRSRSSSRPSRSRPRPGGATPVRRPHPLRRRHRTAAQRNLRAAGAPARPAGGHGRGGRGPHGRRWAHRGRPTQERVAADRAAPGIGLRPTREHLSERAAEVGRPLTGDDYVFTAPEGGPLRRDLLHMRIFRPAVTEAGLPDSFCMHDLRHTCTSILIALGAHPKVIQEWLGHRSITVTMDVYAHLFPSLNQDLADRIDGVFRRAAGAHEAEAATEPETE
jgi:hypothetical protein